MIKKKGFFNAFIRKEGFTFIEMMMVLSIISILLQIGFTAWLDYKRKAYDSAAVTDTRNLLEAIVNDMVENAEVDYRHGPDDGNRIGALDQEGNARAPSLFLSPGVKAEIVGGGVNPIGSDGLYEPTLVDATLWHSEGTPWGATNADGRREFFAYVDEATETIEFSGF